MHKVEGEGEAKQAKANQAKQQQSIGFCGRRLAELWRQLERRRIDGRWCAHDGLRDACPASCLRCAAQRG